jgi:hypothetical protein
LNHLKAIYRTETAGGRAFTHRREAAGDPIAASDRSPDEGVDVTTHHRITRPVAATLVALSIGCAQASARSGHGPPTAGPAARTVPAAPSSSDGRQPTIVRVTPDNGGFDWDDAGIGAAGGFALSMIGLGAAMRFSQQRTRRNRQPGLTN